jgi:hypothetical protein
MNTALLVSDVQQALCLGEYKVFESERVIDRINVVTHKTRSAGAIRLGFPLIVQPFRLRLVFDLIGEALIPSTHLHLSRAFLTDELSGRVRETAR